MIIAVPFVLPTLLPLVVAFFWLRHRYITTGREVKRFDAISRSPVYASFSAALKVCCCAVLYRTVLCQLVLWRLALLVLSAHTSSCFSAGL